MKRSSKTPELFVPKRYVPKTGFFDIETAPLIGYAWQMWDTNIIKRTGGGYMLCFAIKYQGTDKVEWYGLNSFPKPAKGKHRDFYLVQKLWEMLAEVDVIVAHNGDNFDLKVSKQRMIVNGLPPLPPTRTTDTLKIARQVFKFPSNKLNELGIEFNVGKKLPHNGFEVWEGCMAGDPEAWDVMRRYNKQDVILLERVYDKVLPWAKSYPNMNVYNGTAKCPRCQSNRIVRAGKWYMLSSPIQYQRHLCNDCHGYFKGERLERGDDGVLYEA